MIPHIDEILRPAVSTDATAVPRYNLVRPDGTIIEKNVAMRLSNPVAREGTPISKAALDEMLAASGVTAGTATAYTLAQEEYTLFDGAPVRFRLHTASGGGATLNINGTGAKPLRDMMGEPMPGGILAGTWLTAYYSAAAGAYVLAGGEAVRALYGERYTVDDAVAYIKDVPADALPVAEIGEVGGMTYKVNVGTEAAPVYELCSAPVTEVESVGRNLIPFPYKVNNSIIVGNGAKIEIKPDGSLSLSGSPTGYIDLVLYDGDLLWHGKQTMSLQGDFINVYFQITLYRSFADKTVVGTLQSKDVLIFDTNDYPDASCINITVSRGTSGNAIDGTVYPMLNRGSTALPYTPYFHDILPIPEAVRALDGYGWGISATVRNYIDWKNRKFVKMFGRVDMGTLAWYAQPDHAGGFSVTISDIAKSSISVLCAAYPFGTNSFYWSNYANIPDKTINTAPSNYIFIKDTAYTDAASLKASLSGVMLYYELAEPVITDISSLLPADNILGVQPGGTITPINEYGYAVSTTITYQRDVLANRASIFALEKLRLAMELLAKADLSNVSGTFGGVVKANAAAVSALGTAQVRNVTIGAVDLTAGSSALATGDSYRVYS